MLTRLLPLMFIALVLAACVPATQDGPRVIVEQLTEPVSFYPMQTGAAWQYLPDSAQLDEPRLLKVIQGPTIIEGQLMIGSRLVGRGIDEQNFRTYGNDGVFLWRTTKPGSIIDFEPAVQQFPPQSQLAEGATWGGRTTATVTYPEALPEHRTASLDIRYEYTVVDRREASVPAGEFEIYVIDFNSVTVDEEGTVLEELSQTTWFVPYVGQVRTENGYYLVETNFLEQAGAEEE
ncbi:MAG TPA: hypothetical protein VF168_02870 [Trueperaceae bacterium]